MKLESFNKKTQLKIVFLTEAYWGRLINGVVMMVILLSRELAARGHSVSIITPTPFWQPRKPVVIDGVTVYSVPGIPLPGGAGYSIALPWLSKEAESIVRSADVVHTHHPGILGVWAQQLSQRVFLTAHTNYDEYLRAYWPLVADVFRKPLIMWLVKFCNRCSGVIAPAEGAADRLVRYGVKEDPQVISNGIDVKRFVSGNGDEWRSILNLPKHVPHCIYVGRLTTEKRVDMVIKAVARLPKSHLLVVGDGSLSSVLKGLVRELGVQDRVHFLGQIEHSKLPDILAAADIKLTASLTEVNPLVVREAHSAGLPVVCTGGPGMEDVINKYTGVVTKDTLEAFSAGIELLMSQPDHLRKIGMAAQKRALEHYTVSTSVGMLLEFYRTATRS